MKHKIYIKKGDIVKILAGDSKGQEGKVLKVLINDYKAIVEGINLVSKSTKPNAKNTKGGIVKQEAPIHISNLMLIDNSGKPARIEKKADSKEKSVRYSKKTGEVIK
jgi:large subunit ribosomal protein L24